MADRPKPGPITVNITSAIAPDGRVGVVIQLPNGWAVVSPVDAERVAAQLSDAAREVRAMFGDW